MGLQDITTTIIKEAEEKALEIKKETEAKLQSLELEKESKLKALKAKQEANLARLKAKLLAQEKLKINLEKQGKILKKKQELIERIYEKALSSLKNLDDRTYSIFVGKLLKRVKKAKPFQESTFERTEKNGFILKSPTLEADCRFETLVKKARVETEIEVAKILFE